MEHWWTVAAWVNDSAGALVLLGAFEGFAVGPFERRGSARPAVPSVAPPEAPIAIEAPPPLEDAKIATRFESPLVVARVAEGERRPPAR